MEVMAATEGMVGMVMDIAVMAATAMAIVMEMDTTGVTDVVLMSMPLLLPLMLTALPIHLPTALPIHLPTALPHLLFTALPIHLPTALPHLLFTALPQLSTALNLPLHTVLPQFPSTARHLPLLTVMLSLLTPMHIIH